MKIRFKCGNYSKEYHINLPFTIAFLINSAGHLYAPTSHFILSFCIFNRLRMCYFQLILRVVENIKVNSCKQQRNSKLYKYGFL